MMIRWRNFRAILLHFCNLFGGIEAEWKIAPFSVGCNTGAAAAMILAADIVAGAGSMVIA